MKLKEIDIKRAAELDFEYNFVKPEGLLEEGESGETDIVFFVKGVGSRAHKQARSAYDLKIKELRKGQPEDFVIDPELDEELVAEMVAKCVTGWKNIIGDDDKAIEWSEEASVKLFKDYPVFSNAVASAMFNIVARLKNL